MNMTMHGLGYPADPLAEQWQVPIYTNDYLIFTPALVNLRATSTLVTWVTAHAVVMESFERRDRSCSNSHLSLGSPLLECVGSIWALPK